MQLKILQIVSSAVCRALSQQMLLIAHQVQPLIKSDVPPFKAIVQQAGRHGVRELCTRQERVALRLN